MVFTKVKQDTSKNSTKVITDEADHPNVVYVYRAFGEQLGKIGSGEARYTYGGKELDSEIDLYYFNARYYDASVGRYISIDPAQDGVNWYVYCSNNPLSFVDPSGLFDWNTCTVEKGDTLSQIVADANKRAGEVVTTVEEDAKLSGISNPDLIHTGDAIYFSNSAYDKIFPEKMISKYTPYSECK